MIFRSNQNIPALNAIYIEGSESSRDNKDKRVDLKQHTDAVMWTKSYESMTLHAGNTHV